MATICHVSAWAGRTKHQATWFLLNRVYKDSAALTLHTDNCLKINQPKQTKHWDVLEVVQFLSLVFNEYHEFKFLTSFCLLELKKDINTELQRYKTINGIIKRNLGMQMSMIKFTSTYRQLHISRYFSSLDPHTTVVSTVQPVPGWNWNGQSILYLCQGVHHLWQITVGASMKLLQQSIKPVKLHTKLHFTALFKSTWRVLWVMALFWTTIGAVYALVPSLLACLFTSMLIGIELMQTRSLYIQAYKDILILKSAPILCVTQA